MKELNTGLKNLQFFLLASFMSALLGACLLLANNYVGSNEGQISIVSPLQPNPTYTPIPPHPTLRPGFLPTSTPAPTRLFQPNFNKYQ